MGHGREDVLVGHGAPEQGRMTAGRGRQPAHLVRRRIARDPHLRPGPVEYGRTRKVFEAVGAWTNITELKRAEEERVQLRVQLEQTRRLESLVS